MNLKRHLPNLITLGNLFCGCIAVMFAVRATAENDFYLYAFLFVCLGIFLDFFDGFFARLLNASSPLGLQLDSLADMVTSGVVPGIIMLKLIAGAEDIDAFPDFIPYLGFIVTLGSCYRLANFNIDMRQTDSFIGLPTPANALFILSLPLIKFGGSLLALELFGNFYLLIAICIASAYILNAELPLFSLKVKSRGFAANKLQFIFLGISVILLACLQFSGIPIVILFYILLSVMVNRKNRAA